jgi:hypothetical protein
MRDMLLETVLATAILIWGISEGLVTGVDVDKPLPHDHTPRSLDRSEAPIRS